MMVKFIQELVHFVLQVLALNRPTLPRCPQAARSSAGGVPRAHGDLLGYENVVARIESAPDEERPS